MFTFMLIRWSDPISSFSERPNILNIWTYLPRAEVLSTSYSIAQEPSEAWQFVDGAEENADASEHS